MTCGCQLPQERVFQDIHFNRYHNTMMINKLRGDMIEGFSCQAPWTQLSTGWYMYIWIIQTLFKVCRFHERIRTQGETKKICESPHLTWLRSTLKKRVKQLKLKWTKEDSRLEKLRSGWTSLIVNQKEIGCWSPPGKQSTSLPDWDESGEPNNGGGRGEDSDCAHFNGGMTATAIWVYP